MDKSEIRKCEFCGCLTNARLRLCCKEGKDADLKRQGVDGQLDLIVRCNQEKAEKAIILFNEAIKGHSRIGTHGAVGFSNEDRAKKLEEAFGLLIQIKEGTLST